MKPVSFEKLDFGKMAFDVYATKAGTDLVKKFKKLALFAEFRDYKGEDRDKLIRFVMYGYDKNSPFMRLEDREERLTQSALCAGFNETEAETLIYIKVPAVRAMVKAWLVKVQNHRRFRLYINMELAFYEMLENIGTPLEETELDESGVVQAMDPDKKEKAFKVKFDNTKNAMELEQKLEHLANEIFPNFQEVEGLLITDKERSDFIEGAVEGSLIKMAEQRRN